MKRASKAVQRILGRFLENRWTQKSKTGRRNQMGGMEACIDVRREIRVLAWVAGAGVLLAVMFQF